MNKQKRRNHKIRAIKPGIFPALGLLLAGLTVMFLLSGCSLKDVVEPLKDFFGREASAEEATAPGISEETLLSAQVNTAAGKALVKANGEPVTVLVAYKTAEGGEPRINQEGILETHAVGEVVTYAPGSVVLGDDGEPETYAGGEPVTNLLGLSSKDANGEPLTRAQGEEITHGADDIVYDAAGERMTYNGEPYTYEEGEQMYDTDGEPVTYAVTIQKNLLGEPMTDEDGDLKVRAIELVTDEAGDPLISAEGEAETKQLDPQPPEQIVEPPFEEGSYYINNTSSDFVFFSTPEVEAPKINIVLEEGAAEDAAESFRQENGEGMVNNLQLEILGEDLHAIEIQFDAEGYAYFVIPQTGKVLGLAGDIRNGVNILPVDMVTVPYPQYKYWDQPLGTVADSQRWIIEPQNDDTYLIRSAKDRHYVMTVDDTYGIQYANIMLWEENDTDTQKFCITSEVPRIQNELEEGIYYIRSGLSDWMLLSIGDGIYNDERNIYVYTSDQGDGQIFSLEYDDYGFAIIHHNESSKVLTVRGNEAKDDQEIGQYEKDGANWQRWILDPVEGEEGAYYMRSALNVSEVMDLIGGEARNQKPIRLHWNNDTFAQYWYFHDEVIPAPSDFDTMDAYAQTYTSATNYLLMVDSWTNHVGVYEGSKGNWKNVFFWDCVTGKASTPTVKGEYTINSKLYSFDGNTDSPAWYTVYYASSFYPAYFFHSIIYYQGTWDIMDATMGYNASHGCVRLYPDNAKWIYENIPIGTKVVSY